ncbi:hypothetical protein CYMTET_5308 [Cymbomonas tetramitiformis]|uniref:Probable 6-phosphogluconolactonase n=1 Tax=Cymbomonas tetramitiformis TaxID=36881 RepID=A0AAE0GZE8_9CHLO|nr:hypothetical protein CYMTET_5308 [Cymbomonas tetramitiformis]
MLQGLKTAASVDWSKWHVFWVDERCVPHSDPESNYGGAYSALLKDVPIPDSQIYAINDTLCSADTVSAAEAATDYEARLKGLPVEVLPVKDGLPVFDLLLLGFGPDGHICSLFPDHPLLTVTGPWILPIEDSPKPPPKRITFSLPVVNAAAHKCFVACGEGKAEMAAQILKTQSAEGAVPAALVTGNVSWIMDDAAASQLPSKM